VIKCCHKVGSNLSCLLFGYSVWRILFTGLKDVFNRSAILGWTSIAKQLNRKCWDGQQEGDEECGKVAPCDWGARYKGAIFASGSYASVFSSISMTGDLFLFSDGKNLVLARGFEVC
jgi:hypothetical protein